MYLFCLLLSCTNARSCSLWVNASPWPWNPFPSPSSETFLYQLPSLYVSSILSLNKYFHLRKVSIIQTLPPLLKHIIHTPHLTIYFLHLDVNTHPLPSSSIHCKQVFLPITPLIVGHPKSLTENQRTQH